MKVLPTGYAGRDHRFPYKGSAPARLKTNDGETVEATIEDVSATGVALNVETPYDNGTFVQVHIEGFGRVAGSVARVYEGGVAIAFEDRQDEDKLSHLSKKDTQA